MCQNIKILWKWNLLIFAFKVKPLRINFLDLINWKISSEALRILPTKKINTLYIFYNLAFMGKKQQNILKDLYNKQPRSINKKIGIIF